MKERTSPLTIGKVARRTGLSPKTIRYYEEIGLIPRARRSLVVAGNGYRLYDERDVARLMLVRRAKLLDLSLRSIRKLVQAAGRGCCPTMEPTLRRLAKEKMPEVEERIADLRALGKVLRSLVGQTASRPARERRIQLGEEGCGCTGQVRWEPILSRMQKKGDLSRQQK